MTCWRSNAKTVAEPRNQCTYHFMMWRLPAPSISAGWGTVETGLPKASIVAGVQHSVCDKWAHWLRNQPRESTNVRVLGDMLPGSWRYVLIMSWVEQSQNCVHVGILCVYSQNEGNKVNSVKVQETAFICNCFFKNYFPSNSIHPCINNRSRAQLWRFPVSPNLSRRSRRRG